MFISRRRKIVYYPQIVTQTIEVPGTTVEVPGPTVYMDNALLAKFDFATMQNMDLKQDGDYSIPISGGFTSATSAILKAFKCAGNIGAAGIQRINDGCLELNSDTVTSELGKEYWSSKPAPMLAIDLRTLSQKLQTDQPFQKLSFEVVAEIEPLWKDGAKTQQPVYSYFGVGFLSNLDLWAASQDGTPRPVGVLGGIRNLSQTTTERNTEIFRIGCYATSFSRGSFSQGNFSTSPAPLDTWKDNTTRKLSVTWEGLTGIVTHNNGTSSLKANAGAGAAQPTSFTQPSTFVVGRGTNNLWLVIYVSRSTSTMQGEGPFKLKSLSIYERGL
tara:strand:+ start:1 stop:987 length:987 start_codon:yes stop_codon:yes gene_type:complete